MIISKRMAILDPNFYQIAEAGVFHGETAMGFGIPCPRDGKPGCSVVDSLKEHQKRAATHFLSWVWTYKLSTVIDGIGNWLTRDNLDETLTSLWMCALCNNQFRILG